MSKTHIVAVIDRSGSMAALRNDTIGGYNAFLAEQKAVPGEASLSLLLFDNVVDVVFDGDLKDAEPLTEETYTVRGSTALYDAIAHASRIVDRAGSDRVILLVQTDGEENASRETTLEQVRDIFARYKDKGFEVLFMAANQDAFATGHRIGLAAGQAQSYDNNPIGIARAFASMSSTTVAYRGADQKENTQ